MTTHRALRWLTICYLVLAIAMTGATSEGREEAMPISHKHQEFEDSRLLRTQNDRHLQEEAWQPFGDDWVEKTFFSLDVVTMSRNGKCVAAHSRDIIYIKAVMPDGTLVSKGQISLPPDSAAAYAEVVNKIGFDDSTGYIGYDAISLSRNCDYIGLLYSHRCFKYDCLPFAEAHVTVHKFIGENDWVQVGEPIISSPPDYRTLGVSLSDDGKRTIICNDRGSDAEGESYSCQVHHFVGGDWVPLGQPLPRTAEISGDGNTVATTDSVFKLKSDSSSIWEEIKVNRGSGNPGVASSTELSQGGEVIAQGYTSSVLGEGPVLVFRWDESSKSYQKMGNPIYGHDGEVCGQHGSISLSADGMHIAVACNGEKGYVMTLDYDEKSDKWTHVGSPKELSNEENGLIRRHSIDMSGDGKRLIISLSNRARLYIRKSQQGGTGTFEAPVDVRVECDGKGIDSSITGKAVANGTDQCPRVEITESDSIAWTGCGETKTVRRRWKATDSCGQTKKAIQKIKIVDTAPPEIIVPASVHRFQPDLIIARCGKVPDYTYKVRAKDSCEGKITRSRFHVADDSVDVFSDGRYEVTIRVSDKCKNAAKVKRTVVVPPKIKGGGVLEKKVTIHQYSPKLQQEHFIFDFERHSCPSSLEATREGVVMLPLSIKFRDCQGKRYPDGHYYTKQGTKREPKLRNVYKVLPKKRLKRTGISFSKPDFEMRPLEYNKGKHRWEYMLNATDLIGPGCYLAEFQLRLRSLDYVYATANFVLK